MQEDRVVSAGFDELERAADIARELHAGCCQPLRSPRMDNLEDTLRQAHVALAKLDGEPGSAKRVIEILEDAGGQLGYLQVTCCSPARIRLYTEALGRLGTVQRLITRTHDLEH